MQEGQEQHERGEPNPKTGHHSTHHSRHSIEPQGKRQGGRQHTDGDTNIQRGVSNTPPFTHHATHHPLCRPTVQDGPTHHHDEGVADRGYPTTRTAQTDTHTHTTHLARNSAQHDSSTRQHCNGMSRARATPPHWAGRQQRTPPPFHTPRRVDTIHSSTHLLSLIHVHTTDDQR